MDRQLKKVVKNDEFKEQVWHSIDFVKQHGDEAKKYGAIALAVGLDGSLYMADPSLHRVRRIDPSGQISTVAGDGDDCTTSGSCGNGGPATSAALGHTQPARS